MKRGVSPLSWLGRPLACACALAPILLATSSDAGNTALILDGAPGEGITSGHSLYYTDSTASFTATRNSHNGVSCFIETESDCWHVDLTAVNMAPLVVGTYEHAAPYPVEVIPFVTAAIDPGLNVAGGLCSYGHGCNSITGSFVVTELVWGEEGSVVSFHARFTQRCEQFFPPLDGEVFFNSTEPLPPPHHITSPLVSHTTQGQPFRYQIRTSKPETSYSASGLPAGLTLDSGTGLISGVPAEHGQFEVSLTATGSSGTLSAVLDLVVNLPGRSTGPYTAVWLNSEPGDPIGMGRDASYGIDDGAFGGIAGHGRPDRGGTLALEFKPTQAFTAHDWSNYFSVHLLAPIGSDLAPGSYVDNDPVGYGPGPELDTVVGHQSADTYGNFTVKELSGDLNAKLQHFRGSFFQFVVPLLRPLRGWISYEAENVITSAPFVFGKEGAPFTYQIIANNEPSSFSSGDLPSGLLLDPLTGGITGTPSVYGVFTVAVTATGASATTSDDILFKIRPAQSLANVSTRARIEAGDNSLIGGFIIMGRDDKKVIIRALGPSLSASGVSDPLNDPMLDLHDSSGVTIASNDDWRSAQAEVEATGIPPSDDHESAIVATLAPGSYSAVVTGKNGATGVGLVEVYDLDPHKDSQLGNISTRSFVDLGDNVLIGGFIVGFAGMEAQSSTMFRALGHSLYWSGGIENYLRDPVLELFNGSGTLLAHNDNWRDSDQSAIFKTGIAPAEDMESAILITLPAGNYTAIVRGKDGGTGVALVEAYELNDSLP